MNYFGLHKRITELIQHYSNGSRTAFAKSVGVSQATLNRNLKAEDDEKLMDITGRVLLAFSEVRSEWLLKGEGAMKATAKPVAAADPAVQNLAAKVQELEAEISSLRQKLIESQKEALTFYRQQASGHSDVFTTRTAPVGVPTGATATYGTPQDNEQQ